MDRKKYGEIIVDQIINDYKNSAEFRNDAARFMYRWFMQILNYKTASLGDLFVQTIENKFVVPEDSKKNFMEGMEKYSDLKAKMDMLYDLLTDEHNKTLYPSNITDSTISKYYPDFLKD